jgi:phospholipid transport system substrate-binding protein
MRIAYIILLVFSFTVQNACASQQTEELEAYVTKLREQGYEIVRNSQLSDQEKKKKSGEIIRSHLYLDWMAKHSLGRHRRAMSKSKLDEFTKVYSDFIVEAYSSLATNYSGEKAVFRHIKQVDESLFLVNTEILRQDSQSPVKVDYLIHKFKNQKGNVYQVGDIITEGVSVLNSQQYEFNSVISSEGIDALIADLKKKSHN